MKYTPTVWITGDVISAVKANNWELQHYSFQFRANTSVTIAAGVITPTRNSHAVDTEAAAASDDLDNISVTNVVEGYPLILQAVSIARIVTVRDGVGNLKINGNYKLDSIHKLLYLVCTGSDWKEMARSQEYGKVIINDGAVAPVGTDKWVAV